MCLVAITMSSLVKYLLWNLGLLCLLGGLTYLSLYNVPLFSVNLLFTLKSTLSDINITIPAFLTEICTIDLSSFYFQPAYITLFEMGFLYTAYNELCFSVHSDNLCLLVDLCRPLIVNVIIDMLGIKFAILFYFFSCLFILFFCFSFFCLLVGYLSIL